MPKSVAHHGWATKKIFDLDALKQPQNEFQSPKIGLKHFSKYELYTQILKILVGRTCILTDEQLHG